MVKIKHFVLDKEVNMGAVGKALLRALAVFLIIGGVIILFGGKKIQEVNQPNSVQFGYVSNGETVIFDSGTIGGNLENVDDGKNLESFGAVVLVSGAILFFVSFLIKSGGDES